MIFIACQYVLAYKKNKLQDCYSIYVLTMNDVSAGAGVTGFNHLYSNELSNELSCRQPHADSGVSWTDVLQCD